MKTFLVAVLVAIITAGVSGTGVYYWQMNQYQNNVNEKQDKTQQQINILQNQLTQLKEEKETLQKTLIEEATLRIQQINHKTFSDPETGFSFTYSEKYIYDSGLWTPERYETKNVIASVTHIPNISVDISKITSGQTIEEYIVNKLQLPQEALQIIQNTLDEGYMITEEYPNYHFKHLNLNGNNIIMVEGSELHTTTYYFATDDVNILEISTIFDDERINLHNIAETINLKKLSLCTDPSQDTEMGRPIFPIDNKYQNINFLGQIFTAYSCGEKRVNQIFGVENDNYTLGSTIWLTNNPSQSLINTFNALGFGCNEDAVDENCKQWKLEEVIPIKDLILLQPYYENFQGDDCIHCG